MVSATKSLDRLRRRYHDLLYTESTGPKQAERKRARLRGLEIMIQRCLDREVFA